MILRTITSEEIAAITTLIQCAENVGSGVWSDEDIYEAIKATYQNTPPVRSKDVDFGWMLELMQNVKNHLEDTFRISYKDGMTPTLSDLPVDYIFDILASKNTNDQAGELLDELERRLNLASAVNTNVAF